MRDRLSSLLREKKLSAVKFAEILEVQPSSISHLLSGRNKPSFEFVEKLLERFPDISPDWFISGKGEMLRDSVIRPDLSGKDVSLPLFDQAAVTSPVKNQGELLGGSFADHRKTIEKIVFFYSDNTFSVYAAGNDVVKNG